MRASGTVKAVCRKVVCGFKLLCKDFVKPRKHLGQSVFGPRFVPGTSQMRCTSANHFAAKFNL